MLRLRPHPSPDKSAINTWLCYAQPLLSGVDVIPVTSLNEAVGFIPGTGNILPYVTDVKAITRNARREIPDFSEVKGQAHVKRAMMVAAAGGHNIMTPRTRAIECRMDFREGQVSGRSKKRK